MSEEISSFKAEVDQLRRELAELREKFENHLSEPFFENPPQLRPSTRERQMG